MCVYVHTHTVNACPILQGSVSCVPNWLGPMGDQSLNLGTGVAGHVGADMVVLLLFVWGGGEGAVHDRTNKWRNKARTTEEEQMCANIRTTGY